MLRRLLACLALLTGLMAGAVPAYATGAMPHGTQMEATARDDNGPSIPAVACSDRARQQQARGDKAGPCRSGRTITIVIPTVQMGVDRAFE